MQFIQSCCQIFSWAQVAVKLRDRETQRKPSKFVLQALNDQMVVAILLVCLFISLLPSRTWPRTEQVKQTCTALLQFKEEARTETASCCFAYTCTESMLTLDKNPDRRYSWVPTPAQHPELQQITINFNKLKKKSRCSPVFMSSWTIFYIKDHSYKHLI